MIVTKGGVMGRFQAATVGVLTLVLLTFTGCAEQLQATPTPGIDATVEARLQQRIEATEVARVPSPEPSFTPTAAATASPSPTLTPTPPPSPTPVPTLTPTATVSGPTEYELTIVDLIGQESAIYQEYLDSGDPSFEAGNQWVGSVQALEHEAIGVMHRWGDIEPPAEYEAFHRQYLLALEQALEAIKIAPGFATTDLARHKEVAEAWTATLASARNIREAAKANLEPGDAIYGAVNNLTDLTGYPVAGPVPTLTPPPTPTPSATPTPGPTATPTPEPTPTATQKPTATPVPSPTATSVPTPTATPEPVATPTPEPTATPIPTATATSETVSQRNAVRKAKSYLDYSAFSRDGLVEQLEYEGFSHADAVYGADNSGADWYEQAVRKAQSYMEYSAFSRGSLIEQLKYEGFTQAQAEYGADAVGL